MFRKPRHLWLKIILYCYCTAMDASHLSKNASCMPDEHVASQDKPLPHGALRICKEAACVRPLVRICENSHIHTHIVSLSQNAGCQTKFRQRMHLPVFSNAVGLNLPAQISEHQLILATTSKAMVNGSFSLGMIPCLVFCSSSSFLFSLVAASRALLHRSHVQYSLSGGASGMPCPPAPARVNRPVETNCSYAAFSPSVYSRLGSVSL